MSKTVSLSLAFLVLASWGCHRLDAKDRTADLRKLHSYVDLDQSYSSEGRVEARRQIDVLIQKGETLEAPQFFLAVAKIAALADNGHSNLSLYPARRHFGLGPIRVFWFSDGLYVVRARNAHADLLGGRVTTIAGKPIEWVENRMKQYHGGTAENFRAYYAPVLLLSPRLLH